MRSPLLAVLCLLAASSVPAQPLNGTFPNWQERTVAQLTNRARVDPAAELAGCPAGQCAEAACYSARAPLAWNYDLNQAARFHSVTMGMFPFFGHDTPCVVFPDIDTRFPGSSTGSFASSCSASGLTSDNQRVGLFGTGQSGENIAAGQHTPHAVFYVWLYEAAASSGCGFTFQNGHRYNILTNGGPALGVGHASVSGSPYSNYWTQDFGGSGAIPKIPSGSHWTATNRLRDPSPGDSSVEFWANWYDPAGGAPTTATVVLDNIPTAMTRPRGSATNGAYTATISGVSTACHSYYFSFVDSSLGVVRYPTTGVLGFGAGCPDYQGGEVAPAAPEGVNAVATSSTTVQVTWSAVAGATSYQVERRDPGGSFNVRGSSLTTSYDDTADAGKAYLYRVRAVNPGGSSGNSAYDLATTVMFADDPLSAGVPVKSLHLAELRNAVSAVRAQAGPGSVTYTEAAASGLTVKAIHITELRAQLDSAMATLGLATGGWTDASLSGVAIKATHFQQIRNRLK